MLRFTKLISHAKVPTRSTLSPAIYNLYSSHFAVVETGKITRINTDVIVHMPEGYYGQFVVDPTLRDQLEVISGTTGPKDELSVLVRGLRNEKYVIDQGIIFAQMIVRQDPVMYILQNTTYNQC